MSVLNKEKDFSIGQKVNFTHIGEKNNKPDIKTCFGNIIDLNDDLVKISSNGEEVTVKSKLVTLMNQRTALTAATLATSNGEELLKALS